MDGFTEADRERMLESLRNDGAHAAQLEQLRRTMGQKLDTLEANQRRTMRRQARVAPVDRIADAIEAKIRRRWLLVLGAGMMLGSALGGATGEIVRKLVQNALGVH